MHDRGPLACGTYIWDQIKLKRGLRKSRSVSLWRHGSKLKRHIYHKPLSYKQLYETIVLCHPDSIYSRRFFKYFTSFFFFPILAINLSSNKNSGGTHCPNVMVRTLIFKPNRQHLSKLYKASPRSLLFYNYINIILLRRIHVTSSYSDIITSLGIFFICSEMFNKRLL